ncbi:uncharacterized protein [Procambarus clarkii]|uniref:uncharacterized protein n=1 Tax=Procambarus clarkii TaxID=6728 RepID=UPI003742C036
MVFLAIPVMLLLTQVISGVHITWQRSILPPGVSDVRYLNASLVILSKSNRWMSQAVCAIACGQHPLCVSYNYNGGDAVCELMSYNPYTADPNMVSAPGWGHFTVRFPKLTQDPSLCSPGSVMLPYDHPVHAKYHPEINLYTCSNNSWIFSQNTLGKTNCRLVLMYESNIPSTSVHVVSGDVLTYHNVLHQCLRYSCLSVVCFLTLDACWMKNHSHISASLPIVTDPRSMYFYTYCQ